ncbi:MAG: YajQ family cyclic di-GMP-binding protein [Bdellovibrionota bacterium]
MPSFDVVSEINWQSMDDAINQTLKAIINRYDFKGIKTEITMDQKEKAIKIFCSEASKIEPVKDIFHEKLIRRGVPLLAIEYGKEEKSSGSGIKLVATVAAGVTKETGKESVAVLKQEMKKVQAQINDDRVRVSSKSRDELQEAIAFLRTQEDKVGIPLQFNNFRE